jgi:hypothetical protein
MALAFYHFRASLGRRWRSYVAIAVLLGLLGGVGLLAIAGARRTQSAYPRFLRSAAASTMAVDAGPYDPQLQQVANFPQVRQARTYIAFNVAPLVDGRPDTSVNFEAMGSLDGRFFDQDRFTPTKGRRPNPARVDEVSVNEYTAKKWGYHVGQRIDLGTYSDEQVRDPKFEQHPSAPKLAISATIVGIGLFTEEVLQDESDSSQLLLLTPAYTSRALPWATYAWQGLVLKHGDADVDAVKRQFIALLDPGSPQFFRVTSVDTFHSLRAMRPLSLALGLFGAIAGLATLVLVGQALGRLLRSEREERVVLRSLGATPLTIVRSAMVGPVITVLLGTVFALAVAVLGSAVTPVGRVRKIEVTPGLQLDLTVLGIGAGGLITLLLGVVALMTWREVTRPVNRDPARPSVIVGAATARRVSPVAVAGLRLALEPGAGRTTVPTRSVMAGAAMAVTALVASLTFGSSLHSLVASHRLYGWNWDATYEDRQGYGNARIDGAHDVLDKNPDVESWSSAYFGSDLVDGRNIPLLGMAAGSAVLPPIVRGRAAANASEVVLGAATASQLGKGIGDRISVGASSPHALRIVGFATLPTIGIVHGAHTSLGVGALVAPELVPGFDRNITETPVGGGPPLRVGPNAIFIRFHPHANVKATFARLSHSIDPIASFPGTGTLIAAQRPAEIVNSSEIGGSPSLLAGTLALGAMASLGLALATSVHRRRRDLALLKALGFTRPQIRATVAWQATATIAVGLLIGVPLGIVSGRALWDLFALQLDVVPRPSVPVLAVAGLVVSGVVLANLIAAVPAGVASRIHPSLVLRSE